jgi:hypothetical protein
MPAPRAAARSERRATAAEEIRERADTVWTRHVRQVRPRRLPPMSDRQELKGRRGRVAIVDGCRTPFAKAGTDFRTWTSSTWPASRPPSSWRAPASTRRDRLSVFGTVIPALHAPNLGREVVFRASLPDDIPAPR